MNAFAHPSCGAVIRPTHGLYLVFSSLTASGFWSGRSRSRRTPSSPAMACFRDVVARAPLERSLARAMSLSPRYSRGSRRELPVLLHVARAVLMIGTPANGDTFRHTSSTKAPTASGVMTARYALTNPAGRVDAGSSASAAVRRGGPVAGLERVGDRLKR
jgi:hypothetical protein